MKNGLGSAISVMGLSMAAALALGVPVAAWAKDSSPDAKGIVRLDLTDFTNMGFEDDSAGDERGGWNDHGDNNAKNFPIFQDVFAGVPFKIVNPAENGKTSIVVFKNHRKRDGVEKITMNVKPAAAARAVNLLHCTAWGRTDSDNVPIGFLEVADDAGRTAKFDVKYETDVSEWWSWGKPKNLPNKVMGCQIPPRRAMAMRLSRSIDFPRISARSPG